MILASLVASLSMAKYLPKEQCAPVLLHALLWIIDLAIGMTTFMRSQIDAEKKTDTLLDDVRYYAEKEASPVFTSEIPFVNGLVSQGWKAGLFNVKDEITKQVMGLAVIASLINWSLDGLVSGSHVALSCMVMVYAGASAYTYFNQGQSRFADAAQVNVVTLCLTGMCLLALLWGCDVRGLLATLVIDSYCGLRQADEDQEKYRLVSMFFTQSWTQDGFNLKGQLHKQIAGAALIFAELSVSTMVAEQGLGYLPLAYSIAKLLCFISECHPWASFVQSDGAALLVAASLVGSSGFGLLCFLVLLADGFSGAYMFVSKHAFQLNQYLKVASAEHYMRM